MNHDLLPAAVTAANMLFTGFRIVAHVPQLIAVIRDPDGARSIAISSWAMFAMANSSNAVYALVLASDWAMALINLLSALSCASIVAITVFKRWQLARIANRCAHFDSAGIAAPDSRYPVGGVFGR